MKKTVSKLIPVFCLFLLLVLAGKGFNSQVESSCKDRN